MTKYSTVSTFPLDLEIYWVGNRQAASCIPQRVLTAQLLHDGHSAYMPAPVSHDETDVTPLPMTAHRCEYYHY